jgi:hypothetical protein
MKLRFQVWLAEKGMFYIGIGLLLASIIVSDYIHGYYN